MKKILSLFVLSLLWFSYSYAAELSSAPSAVSESNTSITVSWEENTDALGYYLYYDTQSGVGGDYAFEVWDLIEATQYRIEGLLPSTTYFVAISIVDGNGIEGARSPEWQFSTTGAENAFALDEVEATGTQELTLTFNADLDSTSNEDSEFLILHNDTQEEIFVETREIVEEEQNKIVLTLDRELELGAKYDFTILSIIDIDGRNIESGIDALTTFDVPSFFAPEEPVEEVVEEPAEETPSQQEDAPIENIEEVDLNAAWPEENEWGNAGKILSQDEVKHDTLNEVAEDNENLPQTWPEHILLLILALLAAMGVFYFQSTRAKV